MLRAYQQSLCQQDIPPLIPSGARSGCAAVRSAEEVRVLKDLRVVKESDDAVVIWSVFVRAVRGLLAWVRDQCRMNGAVCQVCSAAARACGVSILIQRAMVTHP